MRLEQKDRTDSNNASQAEGGGVAGGGFSRKAFRADQDTEIGTEDEMVVEAVTENLPDVLAFVDERLERIGCPVKTRMQIDVAAEEVFVNIASYAYAPEKGYAAVRLEVCGDPVTVMITFIDRGVPYDPLKPEDPDVTLPTAARQIGGLGVFMTKKLMDDVSYEYSEGQNILTLKKNL